MTEEIRMSSETVQHDFATPGPVDLRIELTSGSIDITADEVAVTTIELEAVGGDSHALDLIAAARIEQHGDKVFVLVPRSKSSMFGRKGHVHATITVPTASSVRADTGGADVTGQGRFAAVTVNSGSGDIELDKIESGELKVGSGDVEVETIAASIKVKAGSGDVRLGPVGGSCDVASGSGDITLEGVDDTLKVKTGSGDVIVKRGGERVEVMAGSGDLTVQRVHRGDVSAKTGSGDISIGVARGTAAYLDIHTVTGSVTSHLEASDHPDEDDQTVAISVMSGTGDVVLQHA